MNGSPRIQVLLDRDEVDAATLRSVATFTGVGLLAARDCITAALPVIDEEMFTNAWFDERAAQLLELLASWRQWSVRFELAKRRDGSDVEPLELETLRAIIEAELEERC